MLIIRLFVFLVLAVPYSVYAWQQDALDTKAEPLHSNANIAGQMLANDAEFLTPQGITDIMPAPVQPLENIEPAAGYETISTTITDI